MEASSVIPIVISTCALAVSAFTFWWTNVRDPKAFYFVRIDHLIGFKSFDFALMNAGRKDVLVTAVQLSLEGRDPGTRFYPAATVQMTENTSVIAAGKSVQVQARLKEPLASDYIERHGRRQHTGQNMLSFYVCVDVCWVDPRGKAHISRIVHSIIGFDPDGKYKSFSPFAEKSARYELHAVATAA